MKILITGASSGIGMQMAKYLDREENELFLVARSKDKLLELQKQLKCKSNIIIKDLSKEQEVISLYDELKNENIDFLINNAGFGLFGYFTETNLDQELEMINTNMKAVHILSKLFVKDMEKRNSGYILNVGSVASFMSGPLMNTYYSTKSYVYRFTEALYYEEKKKNKNIHISVLCPGPVDTNFNKVAGVSFGLKGLNSEYVAKYAVDKALKGKLVIMPGLSIKLAKFFIRFVPDKLLMDMTYKMQRKKEK